MYKNGDYGDRYFMIMRGTVSVQISKEAAKLQQVDSFATSITGSYMNLPDCNSLILAAHSKHEMDK